MLREFQFLIGRLKTKRVVSSWTRCCIVSIPHRQAKNEMMMLIWMELLKFQFLIGRLKTTLPLGALSQVTLFQFLIGRLKTQVQDRRRVRSGLVSIPHRQAKNWLSEVPLKSHFSRFNSS